MNRNIFSTNQSTNIFNNNNTNNNNNNNSGQSNNIFTRSQANNQNNSSGSQNNRNIFAQNNSNGSSNNQGANIFNNQSSSSNIFNNNQSNNNNNNSNNSSSGNIFNNSNNQGNNIFSNNNNQGGNLFSNNNNQGANIFNNNNNQSGNIFNNNRPSNNIFNNNQNNNNYNNNNNNNSNNPLFFQDPMLAINFTNLNPEEQKYLFSKLSIQQIKIYVEHHVKMMNEGNKLQIIRLSRENSIKGQKITKFAADFNIKKEILHIKKTIKDNVCVPVKNLKAQNEKLMKQSFELVSNLFSSLEKQKQRLIGVIQEDKMSKDIKAEFQQINNQIEDFLRPLFNSHTKGGNFTFVDPDAFCIHISQLILKNIASLDSKMDDLISCQNQNSEELESLANTIEQLLAYFENVAIEFQSFNAKYNELKRRKLLNHEGTLEKISKKAANAVSMEMKSYKLIKEIEEILQKRIKKTSQ